MYKADWISRHLTSGQVLGTYRNYISDTIAQLQHDASEKPWSLEDYIEEFGHGYEPYASYDEFLETEYKDYEYLIDLIGENNYKFLLENDGFFDKYRTAKIMDNRYRLEETTPLFLTKA